jgi:hypothetical protein
LLRPSIEVTASYTETCTIDMIRCPVAPAPSLPTMAQALSFQSVITSARERGAANAQTTARPAMDDLSAYLIFVSEG